MIESIGKHKEVMKVILLDCMCCGKDIALLDCNDHPFGLCLECAERRGYEYPKEFDIKQDEEVNRWLIKTDTA
jgi:hypothetical protein